MSVCVWVVVGGGGGKGVCMCVCEGGTLNFVCYIGWAPASSVYPEKYTVYQPYYKYPEYQPTPKNTFVSVDISILKKYSHCLLFFIYKCGFHLIFLYNGCISNINALNSFQQ